MRFIEHMVSRKTSTWIFVLYAQAIVLLKLLRVAMRITPIYEQTQNYSEQLTLTQWARMVITSLGASSININKSKNNFHVECSGKNRKCTILFLASEWHWVGRHRLAKLMLSCTPRWRLYRLFWFNTVNSFSIQGYFNYTDTIF